MTIASAALPPKKALIMPCGSQPARWYIDSGLVSGPDWLMGKWRRMGKTVAWQLVHQTARRVIFAPGRGMVNRQPTARGTVKPGRAVAV